MATHVYANGEEIACKSADGIAKTAFPDPCWSPPGPAAGPVLIPYPNTAFARDITNGTATVFIQGKEVAIEDKAYFSTSTGNEPATKAFGQGQKTGVIKGKAYFQKWSFDVIFEGLGVDRHCDPVGHNHGSMPSNTPLFPYMSRSFFRGHGCKKEEERIKRDCEPEDDLSATKKEIKGKSKVSALLKAKRQPAVTVGKKTKDKHWTEDHCDGLDVKLDSQEKALEKAREMGEVYKQLPGEMAILGALESELNEMATKAGAKATAKWGAKAGLKQGVGSSALGPGNLVMGVWSLIDAGFAIADVNEIRKVALESLEQIKVLQNQLTRLQAIASNFQEFDKLSRADQLEKAQELGTEGQDILATLNACTRARKCNLVPKDKKDGAKNTETADGKGCCPGQTGHHLIYDAMIKDSNCPGYEYGTAPTVCVEGTSQHFGSHKRVHDNMDKATKDLARRGKLPGGTMSLDDTINNAVRAHMEAFPLSRCKPNCIKAQLDEYYKKKCPNAQLKAVDKNGKSATQHEGESQR